MDSSQDQGGGGAATGTNFGSNPDEAFLIDSFFMPGGILDPDQEEKAEGKDGGNKTDANPTSGTTTTNANESAMDTLNQSASTLNVDVTVATSHLDPQSSLWTGVGAATAETTPSNLQSPLDAFFECNTYEQDTNDQLHLNNVAETLFGTVDENFPTTASATDVPLLSSSSIGLHNRRLDPALAAAITGTPLAAAVSQEEEDVRKMVMALSSSLEVGAEPSNLPDHLILPDSPPKIIRHRHSSSVAAATSDTTSGGAMARGENHHAMTMVDYQSTTSSLSSGSAGSGNSQQQQAQPFSTSTLRHQSPLFTGDYVTNDPSFQQESLMVPFGVSETYHQQGMQDLGFTSSPKAQYLPVRATHPSPTESPRTPTGYQHVTLTQSQARAFPTHQMKPPSVARTAPKTPNSKPARIQAAKQAEGAPSQSQSSRQKLQKPTYAVQSQARYKAQSNSKKPLSYTQQVQASIKANPISLSMQREKATNVTQAQRQAEPQKPTFSSVTGANRTIHTTVLTSRNQEEAKKVASTASRKTNTENVSSSEKVRIIRRPVSTTSTTQSASQSSAADPDAWTTLKRRKSAPHQRHFEQEAKQEHHHTDSKRQQQSHDYSRLLLADESEIFGRRDSYDSHQSDENDNHHGSNGASRNTDLNNEYINNHTINHHGSIWVANGHANASSTRNLIRLRWPSKNLIVECIDFVQHVIEFAVTLITLMIQEAVNEGIEQRHIAICYGLVYWGPVFSHIVMDMCFWLPHFFPGMVMAVSMAWICRITKEDRALVQREAFLSRQQKPGHSGSGKKKGRAIHHSNSGQARHNTNNSTTTSGNNHNQKPPEEDILLQESRALEAKVCLFLIKKFRVILPTLCVIRSILGPGLDQGNLAALRCVAAFGLATLKTVNLFSPLVWISACLQFLFVLAMHDSETYMQRWYGVEILVTSLGLSTLRFLRVGGIRQRA